jgi:hypothetical protein
MSGEHTVEADRVEAGDDLERVEGRGRERRRAYQD